LSYLNIGFGITVHGRNSGSNIGGAKIAENKIEWYFTVITIDYTDLEKKNRIAKFELG
jgi:hypothetical protein